MNHQPDASFEVRMETALDQGIYNYYQVEAGRSGKWGEIQEPPRSIPRPKIGEALAELYGGDPYTVDVDQVESQPIQTETLSAKEELQRQLALSIARRLSGQKDGPQVEAIILARQAKRSQSRA